MGDPRRPGDRQRLSVHRHLQRPAQLPRTPITRSHRTQASGHGNGPQRDPRQPPGAPPDLLGRRGAGTPDGAPPTTQQPSRALRTAPAAPRRPTDAPTEPNLTHQGPAGNTNPHPRTGATSSDQEREKMAPSEDPRPRARASRCSRARCAADSPAPRIACFARLSYSQGHTNTAIGLDGPTVPAP